MYNKPFYFSETERYTKDILNYKWRERKTNNHTFMRGFRLPYDSGNPNLSYTLVDPKNYDLIYHSVIVPDVFIERYDVFPNNGTAPLVNKKVKNLLENLCPEDVQFFPVMIKNDNDKIDHFENHDYWLLNICSIYEDVNFEKSEFKYGSPGTCIEGALLGYKKCVFNEIVDQKIPHISRLIHSQAHIIVSPELVKRFKKEKIKGAKFIKNNDDGDCWR